MKLNQTKSFFGRKKMNDGAFLAGVAHHLERGNGIAMVKLHKMLFAIAINNQLQPFRQCIHHRHTHTMQAAGYFVRIVVKFTTGMQDRHNDFGGRAFFLRVNIGWDTAPVITDANRVIGMNNNGNFVTMPRQRLIYRIIDRLKYHVMQTRPIIGIPYIHARALAYRLESPQYLDVARSIFTTHYFSSIQSVSRETSNAHWHNNITKFFIFRRRH